MVNYNVLKVDHELPKPDPSIVKALFYWFQTQRVKKVNHWNHKPYVATMNGGTGNFCFVWIFCRVQFGLIIQSKFNAMWLGHILQYKNNNNSNKTAIINLPPITVLAMAEIFGFGLFLQEHHGEDWLFQLMANGLIGHTFRRNAERYPPCFCP